jgi:chromosomal replication initiation ATPase DnaA
MTAIQSWEVVEKFCNYRDAEEGPCNGWLRKPEGAMRCPHDGQEDCPNVDQTEARDRFLRLTGLGRRYRNATPEKLLGLHVSNGNREAAEGIAGYMAAMPGNLREGRGYMLLGTVGGGKTYALALTALAARKHLPEGVRFVFCPELFALLHGRDDASAGRREDLRTCGLLLLDDFGVEYVADWGMAQFQAFVEFRHANLLATCITSNLSAADLRGLAGFDRITSRWSESCDVYELASKVDLRRAEVPA